MRKHNFTMYIAGFLFLLLVFLTPFTAVHAQGRTIETIAGEDRTDTAIAVSQQVYTQTPYALIADRGNFPDALSGIALSKVRNAPVLLNRVDRLDSRNLAELKRLGVKEVFLLGGQFSETIDRALNRAGIAVTRVAGNNRYDTNRMVVEQSYGNSIRSAIIVSGEEFADAVSGVSLAYQQNRPILLMDSRGNQLRNIQRAFPQLRNVIIIGGDTRVPYTVDRAFAQSERIAGDDRYHTARLVDERYFSDNSHLIVTTGQDFADAVSAVSLAKQGSNIRLLRSRVSEVKTNQDITIVGGRIMDDTQTQTKQKAVLWVNPHQDDETLNAGLTLMRDAKEGKEIFVMQVTRGDATSVLPAINLRLQREGFPVIDLLGLVNSRNKELLDAMQAIGMPVENFINLDYPERVATVSDVERHVTEWVRANEHRYDIEIKTLAADRRFDPSAGWEEHKTVREGVRAFSRKNPHIPANYYLSDYNSPNVSSSEYRVIGNMTSAERALWDQMIDAYLVWDPLNGRYAVGGRSLGGIITLMRNMKVNYEKLPDAPFY